MVYYSIIEGNEDLDSDGNKTFILSESGNLTVHDRDDFLQQANQTITLNILLSDSDGKQAFVSGQIELASADLLNPAQEPIEPEPQNLAPIGTSFTLLIKNEDWKNGVLQEINASDPEGGKVYYLITEGNRDYDLDGNRTFLLSETGSLSVLDQDDFLLQANRTINLKFLLSDSEGNQTFVSGQIELAGEDLLNPVAEPEPQNLAPVGTPFALLVNDEDWKNGILHEINASDPEGGTIYYAITEGNQDYDLDGKRTFYLSETGALSVLDYEDFISQANRTINLKILLFDSDGNQTFVSGQIELAGEDLLNPVVEPEPQNLAPVATPFALLVNDEDWKNGVLHEINASDPEGGTIYYAITEGNQDYDLDGKRTFYLSETGALSVLDYEDFISQAAKTINLKILLFDSDGNQTFVSGQIELAGEDLLNPVAEPEPQNLPPISSSFEVSVNDNFWKNGALHEINASDPEGGTVYYTLTEGNRDYDLDGNRTFLLSETGVLSVWDQDDFILQANQEINLNIRLSDSEGNQVSISGQIELGNGLVLNSFPKKFRP